MKWFVFLLFLNLYNIIFYLKTVGEFETTAVDVVYNNIAFIEIIIKLQEISSQYVRYRIRYTSS